MKKTELLRELNHIYALPDGWDGYGAIKIQKPCYEWTKMVIENMPEDRVYSIYPNPNGTISLEWDDKNLEIGNTKFLYVFPISSIFWPIFEDKKTHCVDGANVQLKVLFKKLFSRPNVP